MGIFGKKRLISKYIVILVDCVYISKNVPLNIYDDLILSSIEGINMGSNVDTLIVGDF